MHYVTAQLTASTAPTRTPSRPVPAVLAPVNERAFLTHCLVAKPVGRSYPERLEDDHLTADVAIRARDHLLAHYEDPLSGLS